MWTRRSTIPIICSCRRVALQRVETVAVAGMVIAMRQVPLSSSCASRVVRLSGVAILALALVAPAAACNCRRKCERVWVLPLTALELEEAVAVVVVVEVVVMAPPHQLAVAAMVAVAAVVTVVATVVVAVLAAVAAVAVVPPSSSTSATLLLHPSKST